MKKARLAAKKKKKKAALRKGNIWDRVQPQPQCKVRLPKGAPQPAAQETRKLWSISSLNINKPGYKHQLCKKGDFFFVRLCLPTLKYSPVASSIGVSRHGDFSFNPAFII